MQHTGGYRDSPQIDTILTTPSAGYLYMVFKAYTAVRRSLKLRPHNVRKPRDRLVCVKRSYYPFSIS